MRRLLPLLAMLGACAHPKVYELSMPYGSKGVLLITVTERGAGGARTARTYGLRRGEWPMAEDGSWALFWGEDPPAHVKAAEPAPGAYFVHKDPFLLVSRYGRLRAAQVPAALAGSGGESALAGVSASGSRVSVEYDGPGGRRRLTESQLGLRRVLSLRFVRPTKALETPFEEIK